ncbi:MAG: hypothetical protein WDA00_01080 [Eubacteriales bacterium]
MKHNKPFALLLALALLVSFTPMPFRAEALSGLFSAAAEAIPPELPLLEPPAGGYVMPDLYNTGYRCAEEDLVDFHVKYPSFKPGGAVTITEALATEYNYEFSHFRLNGSIKVTATSPVYIHDFYIDAGTSFYGLTNDGCPLVTMTDGEAVGSRSAFFNAGNLLLERIYCHDVMADHMKAYNNLTVRSCYIRDGGTRNPGSHADGIQLSGSCDNVRIVGNRFDLPGMGYEHVANAAIFIKPEKHATIVSNLQIDGNWLNGGGHTVYLTSGYLGSENMHHIYFTNNQTGCGRSFGPLTWGSTTPFSSDDLSGYDGNIHSVSLLSAGSVVFYDGGLDGARMASIDDVTGDSVGVLISMANYTNVEQDYEVVLRLFDAEGHVVSTNRSQESIRRNLSSSQYITTANSYTEEKANLNGEVFTVTMLYEYPDLPSDVPHTVLWEGLPADLAGHRIEVAVYDGTEQSGTLIRSQAFGSVVTENQEPTPDPADVRHEAEMQALQAALANMATGGTLAGRYAALEAVLESYEAVSDKTRPDAVAVYAQLQQQQTNYQNRIDAYHRQYEQLLSAAVVTIRCSAAEAVFADIEELLD